LVEGVKRDGVRADVAGVGAAKREEVALGVERQLGASREIAAPVVGHERLAPLGGPLHRAAEPGSPRPPTPPMTPPPPPAVHFPGGRSRRAAHATSANSG